MNSIVCDTKECYVCGTLQNLHKHHIFKGAYRNLSETYGCWIYLCAYHHNMSNKGIHFDPVLDHFVKQQAQRNWERRFGGREDFIKTFGKSYLTDDARQIEQRCQDCDHFVWMIPTAIRVEDGVCIKDEMKVNLRYHLGSACDDFKEKE